MKMKHYLWMAGIAFLAAGRSSAGRALPRATGNGDIPGYQMDLPDTTSCDNNDDWGCDCPCNSLMGSDYSNSVSEADCTKSDSIDLETMADSPSGVMLGRASGFVRIEDAGRDLFPADTRTASSTCSTCGTSEVGIPRNSQLPRVQWRRVWRSNWSNYPSSFGRGMFVAYDHHVVTFTSGGHAMIELRDPNLFFIQQYQDAGGGVFIPVPGRTNFHTVVSSSAGGKITFSEFGGRTLRFEVTGLVESGNQVRYRIASIADRNGNVITFTYAFPASGTDPSVLEWSTITDSYGRSLQVRYGSFQGSNVVQQVTLPGGRTVTYGYDVTVNPLFFSQVGYGNGIQSTWGFNPTTMTYVRNEALLSPEHSLETIRTTMPNGGAPGRVASIKRADGTFRYNRTGHVDASGNFVNSIYHNGTAFEITHSGTHMLVSHRQQHADGSFESVTTYDVAGASRPVTGFAQPDGRVWGGVRDSQTERFTSRSYPDGSSESSTVNAFGLRTSFTHKSGAIETWTYDSAGNLLAHTEAAGTPVAATERWTYNAKGQVLSHADFNGNLTSYGYDPSTQELTSILLPSSAGQPAGTVTMAYDAAGRVSTLTDPAGRTLRYDYDSASRTVSTTYNDHSTETLTFGTGASSSRLLSSKDRNGNHRLYSYDAAGRVASEQTQDAGTGAILTTTTNTWDGATGRLMAMDVDGDSMEYTYDYKGRVLTVVTHPQPGQSLTTGFLYDQYHLLKQTDPYGRATTYTYDALDRLLTDTRELTPGGSTVTRSNQYDLQGRLIVSIDPIGARSEFDYDARDREIAERVAVGTPEQAAMSTSYDGNGNTLVVVDERGKRWVNTYTARNKARTLSDPLGNHTQYAYDPDGLLGSETNPNGHVTSFFYDSCCGGSTGRLIQITDADANSIHHTYDFNGNRTSTTDQSGRVTDFGYDGLNRKIRMTQDPGGLNLVTSFTYDQTPGAIGTKMTVVDPSGNTVETDYDGLKRKSTIKGNTPTIAFTYDVLAGGFLKNSATVDPGGLAITRSELSDGLGRTVQSIDPLGNPTVMTYDGNGNLLTRIDEDGRPMTYTYDKRNRTLTVTDGIPATTHLVYDAASNLTQVTDADGKVTAYAYNDANRMVTVTFGSGSGTPRTWSYRYLPMGQQQSLAKPDGVVVTSGYDALERLISRSYSTGGEDTFTYHANGLLASASSGLYGAIVDRSNLATSYDKANRMIQESQNIGAGPHGISQELEPDGLIRQIVYPSGQTVDYSFTADRTLSQMSIGGVPQATFSYDRADRQVSMSLANGVTTLRTYDGDSRITSIHHGGIQQWNYRYTNAGDVLVQDDLTVGVRGTAWTYDAAHRLSTHARGQVQGNAVPAPQFFQSFALDPVGNWNKFDNNGVQETRTHDSLNELVARSTVAPPLLYDANGNQVDDGARFIMVYDANDKLREVHDRSSHALLAQYRYDALGRRIEKLVTGTPDVTTRYYYHGPRIAEERDATDAVRATYTYGAEYEDEPLTMDRGGVRYYYHRNRLFHTYALTNGSGAVVERYSYSAYGEMSTYDALYNSRELSSRVGNPFGFSSREFDPESSLLYLRARSFDPVQGRFKQRDPLGVQSDDRVNLYQYVHSSPTMGTDPSGLEAKFTHKHIDKEPEDECWPVGNWREMKRDCCDAPWKSGDPKECSHWEKKGKPHWGQPSAPTTHEEASNLIFKKTYVDVSISKVQTWHVKIEKLQYWKCHAKGLDFLPRCWFSQIGGYIRPGELVKELDWDFPTDIYTYSIEVDENLDFKAAYETAKSLVEKFMKKGE